MTEESFKTEVCITTHKFIEEDDRFLTDSESIFFNNDELILTIEFNVRPDVIVQFVFNWDDKFGYRVCGYATTEERLESRVTHNLDGSVTVRSFGNSTFGFYGFTKNDIQFIYRIGALYDEYCRERYSLE